MKKITKTKLLFLGILILGTFYILKRQQQPFQHDEGFIFGTLYHITYQSDKNLKTEIEKTLKEVDYSLSMFNQQSLLSRINNGEKVKADELILDVFKLGQHIAKSTDGAFDMTVGPLVNAWGFGFKHKQIVDDATVDSLKKIVGYKKIRLLDGFIVKDHPDILLDCGAVAKGYGCDRVAKMLEAKGIRNYLIEIGGEIVLKGINPQHQEWHVGISKPIDDSLKIRGDLETVLHLSDASMATSGNYRNFYYKDGKKVAHTIDPRTGYPVQHSLLSATVITKSCAAADAYATAFMVMGVEAAEAFVNDHKGLEAYFIYADKAGKMKTLFSKGMNKYLPRKK
jgi:thiamine biosynthesis lipoprotein